MIRLLDKATIDKIAAGEVIERPSSVVKELLENAIDAHSTAITVEIKDGGTSFIRVTDNGWGISKDEVRIAYMRHATSKIEQVEDLNNISSLGFRGEALSTIAAVSQTEMITKTSEDLTGIKYVIHGGAEIEYTEVGVPNGTTIVVRNLFYNTPARKKFLKSAMTEASYIFDLLTRLALSHPEISFKLISNGQTKIDTSGNDKIKDTIYQLFGRDITSNLIEVNYQEDDIKISGFIGKPFISRGNRGLENYFINQRFIKSNVINRAIEEGYRTFVMQHKFPFTVLYLELPQDKCDVNVHPTKMEFKYDNEKKLFEVVCHAIRGALTHKEIIPKSGQNNIPKPEINNPSVKPAEPYEVSRKTVENKTITKDTNSTLINTANSQSKQANIPQTNTRAGKYSPTYKILESLRKADEEQKQETGKETVDLSNLLKDEGATYTPGNLTKSEAEDTPENMVTSNIAGDKISMHTSNTAMNAYAQTTENAQAAKEERDLNHKNHLDYTGVQTSMFDDKFLSEKARIKHRLIGQVFDTYWLIQYDNNLYIMDQHAAHEKVKFEELMQNFNNKEIFSQQLMPPMVVTVSYAEHQAIMDNYDLFMKVGYDIEEFGGNEFKINAVPTNLFGLHGRQMFMEFVSSLIQNSGYMSNEIFVKKLASMACKAAIKGNMSMSFQEADALIDKLLTLENPYTCPHGRPTIISMSETELEKKFHRIV